MSGANEKQLLEVESRIREWIESSFSPAQDERLRKNGHLRARFNVSLTPDAEQLLNLALQVAVGSLLKTKFKDLHEEGKDPRRCIEVVLTKEARAEYGEKNPEVAAQLREDTQEDELEPETQSAMTSSPQKSPQKRKLSANILIENAGLAKRFREKTMWEAMSPQKVPAGIEGLKEAKQVLEAGWSAQANGQQEDRKAEMEAVAWLKGFQTCEVTKEGLLESHIGKAVNPWRKHPEKYVANLAASLLHAWKEEYRNADAKKKMEEEKAAAAQAAEEKKAAKGKGRGKGRPSAGGGAGGAEGEKKKKEPKESPEDKEARALLPPSAPPEKVRMELQKVLGETDLATMTVGALRSQLEVALGLEEGFLSSEMLRSWIGAMVQTEILKFMKNMKKKQKAEAKAQAEAEAKDEE